MINSITGVTERFLRYVSVDTQSLDEQEQIPSTEKQLKLAAMLKEELEDGGIWCSDGRAWLCIWLYSG